jgi:hypothetical protein
MELNKEKFIEEIKKEKDEFFNYSGCEYQSVIKLFVDFIVINCEDDDYQGTSLLIIKNNEKYGFLSFGWGSCSGCDALKACETEQDVFQLATELKNSIRYFDSTDELKSFIKNHDWETDLWVQEETKSDFIKKCLAL